MTYRLEICGPGSYRIVNTERLLPNGNMVIHDWYGDEPSALRALDNLRKQERRAKQQPAAPTPKPAKQQQQPAPVQAPGRADTPDIIRASVTDIRHAPRPVQSRCKMCKRLLHQDDTPSCCRTCASRVAFRSIVMR